MFCEAAAGRCRLLVASAFGYDRESATWGRAVELADWLDAHVVDAVSGPFTIGVSRLDAGDAMVSEPDAARRADLQERFGRSWEDRKAALDRHHYDAAVVQLAADAFITHDHRGFMGSIKERDNVPVPVIDAAPALS